MRISNQIFLAARNAGILLRNYGDPRIERSVGCHDRSSAVRGAIVYDYDFEVAVCLVSDARQCIVDGCLSIECRYDDTDQIRFEFQTRPRDGPRTRMVDHSCATNLFRSSRLPLLRARMLDFDDLSLVLQLKAHRCRNHSNCLAKAHI